MTGSSPEDTVGSPDEETAKNMADALTYLVRVARDAGYHHVAADILMVRNRVNWIAKAEEIHRRKSGNA
jgi:hypothetical protein